MIYGRFGETLTLLREASVEGVLNDWIVRPDDRRAQAKKDREKAAERVGYGMMWWCSREFDGKADDGEFLYDLAFCKADEGWKEIDTLREKLMGPERYAEAVGKPLTT